MKMSKGPKDCASITVDPKRLLAWGTSQLKKIEKERKHKKSNSSNENYLALTRRTSHSSTKEKQTIIFEQNPEEKQKRLCALRPSSYSKNFDSECGKLGMNEMEDLIHKSKKKKKDKHELVSVNIELKKGDRSYETNFSDSNKMLNKKGKSEDSDDEERKIRVRKKKKGCMLEGNENISDKESYLIGIKVTKLDDTYTKKTGNKDLKSKSKKDKKIYIYSSDTKNQGETVEIGEHELSPCKKRKKKKKHKDKNREAGASKEESDLEILDIDEHTYEKKRKNKKIRANYSTEHVEKNILFDVNQMENDVNKEISVYTENKKSKKRISLENKEDHCTKVHKKKKKNKENTDRSEVNYLSETDLIASSYVQSQKKKRKGKNTDVMEEISSEIYIKKKKKKKDTESLANSDFSVSCSSISYKTEGTGKLGMNFGKSPISRLLNNQELCSSCCGVNIKCSNKVHNNSSKISTGTETDSSANKQENSNENFNDSQFQNYLPANIKIKQEKFDEPQLPADICKEKTTLNENVQVKQEVCDTSADHEENVGSLSNATIKQEKIYEPADICKEMTTLNENIQVEQEVCDMSTNHEENVGNLSSANDTCYGNGAHTIEIEEHNISNTPISLNTETSDNINSKNYCLNEKQVREIHEDSNKQYFLENCETYYNFCDDKLTLHDETDVYSEIQNKTDNLSEIEVEKKYVVNNEDNLQGKKPHHVSCEAENLHLFKNANTTNSVINDEKVLGEICHNNFSMTKSENINLSQCVTANAEGVIEESVSLGNIPSSNMEQNNQSDIGTSHQEYDQLHVHQNLDKFQSYQHYQSATNNDYHQHSNQSHSGQEYQGLSENKHHQQFNKFQSDRNCQNPTKTDDQQMELKHKINKNSSQSYHSSHKSKHSYERQSHSEIKSLHFSCVRPPLKSEEHVSRLLKVDKSQVELCYYRISSKFYQDVHVKFSDRKHFEVVVRYYANRIRCKSWHIKYDNRHKEIQKRR